MNALLDLPDPHARALLLLLDHLPLDDPAWALTGSAGLRLQGVDVEVHDLDIQSDARGIYLLEERLAKFMRTPVHVWDSGRIRSLDGRASVLGVEVELIADVVVQGPDGPRAGSADPGLRLVLGWRGRQVPVLPLEQEAAAYERLGRHEKAALIRRFLQEGRRG